MSPDLPEPVPAPANRGTWPKAVPFLVLAGLLAYCNSFTKAFVFDDVAWITGDPDIADAGRYMSAWSRPVVRVSVLLNYRLGGLNTAGYHAFNLAVHVFAGLALYGLVRRVLLQPRFGGRYENSAPYLAFAVALLWLVHPLQTQSVTYIIQRCESMMGLFYLFALYAWLRGATGGSRLWYPLSIGSFALCCGCKEVAVTLPPVLLIFDRIFLANSWRELIRERWLAYLGVLAVWGAALVPMIRMALGEGTAGGIGFGVHTATPYQYLLTQSGVILHYIRLSLWPVGQSIDYIDWPIAKSLGEVLPQFLAVSGLLLASLVLLFVRPALGFVLFCFFAFLAPTSSVMPIVDPAFEHRMYLSLASVVIVAVFGFHTLLTAAKWSERTQIALGAGAVAAVAVALTALTIARNETYRTQLTCQEYAAAARPNNPRAWTSIAALYLNAGNLQKADEALRRGEAIPMFTDLAVRQRAAWLALSGRLAEAEGAYQGVIDRSVFHPTSTPRWYKNLAWVRLALGKPAEAVATIQALVELQPQVAENQLLLAALELAAGHEAEAQAAAAEAARLHPNYPRTVSAQLRGLVFAPDSPSTPFLKPFALWQVAAACLVDGDRDPKMLDTLALAYSWHGRFTDAANAAERGSRRPRRMVTPTGKRPCKRGSNSTKQASRMGRGTDALMRCGVRTSSDNPLTIAVPYYSRADYLRVVIDSVLAQSDPHWLLVVADDGPDAAARELVHRYTDCRIRYVRNPTRLGMAGNWNVCLDSATTDLVTICHADDALKTDYVRELRVAADQHPEVSAIFCEVDTIGPEGQRVFSVADQVKRLIRPGRSRALRLAGRSGVEALALGNFLYCPTACYRKSLLGGLRFSARWRFVLDLEFFTDLLFAGHVFLVLPTRLYDYRRHPGSATSQYTENLQRFSEESEFLDELAGKAAVRGWHLAARRARMRWLHRLNLGFCALTDLFHGRAGAAWDKVGALISHRPHARQAKNESTLLHPATKE